VTIPDSGGGDGSVFVLLNAGTDGGGNWLGFSVTVQMPVGVAPSGVAIGDFDGVNGLDLAVCNEGDDDVRVLLNDGTGTAFPALPADVPVGDGPLDIVAADFDGDTVDDLAVANGNDDTVLVLENQGAATFVPLDSFDVGNHPVRMDVRDLDDDRDLDLVVVNQNDGTVTIGFQDAGAFGTTVTIPVGQSPFDVRVVDLDRDGGATIGNLPDIVTANSGDDTVSVILNLGGQTFTPAVSLPVGDLPRSITSIDIEGDGDRDIVVVANDETATRVAQLLRNDQENPGDPLAFAAAADLDAGADPVFLLTGDVDQDTDEDLIAVNGDLGGASPLAGPGAEAADGPTPGAVNTLVNMDVLPCPGDLDGSAEVGFGDILNIIGAWGACPPECPQDLSGNGQVDFADILFVIAAWGPCP